MQNRPLKTAKAISMSKSKSMSRSKAFGFGHKTETETECLLLVTLTNKKVSLSWFFFLGMKSLPRSLKPDFAVFNAFSTKFYTFGKIGDFDHASSLRKPR